MPRGTRRTPPVDVLFAPGERAGIDAESERIRAALAEAGLRPQRPGFAHRHWRGEALGALRAAAPRHADLTAATLAAALVEFGRHIGDGLAYARVPYASLAFDPPEGCGLVPSRIDPDVASVLAAARALGPAFAAFMGRRARGSPQ